MRLKKIIVVILAAVLLALSCGALAEAYLFPVAPVTPAATDLSMPEAVTIAKNEVTARQGLPLEDIQNYRIKASFVQLENSEDAWVVLLEGNEMSSRTTAALIISSTDGAVIDYQASNTEVTIDLIDQWKKSKGPMTAWSLEDKALFNLLYGSSDTYVVPGDEHISQEEASNIALSALPQSLSSPEFSYTFHLMSYTDGTPDQYVWMVTVLEHGKEKYLVHVSANDGAVIEIFDLGSGLG